VFLLWSYRSSRAEAVVDQDSVLNEVEFSLDRYEPMTRLMNEGDLLFLKSQPGFRPELGKKFSQERRRIFRLYLKELARDFHRMHARARVMAASLPADHSPLVGMLIRQQARFWYEITAIELRLSLNWMGSTSLNARGLIDALATMHTEINRATMAAAAA
jgi:hypothetical protein